MLRSWTTAVPSAAQSHLPSGLRSWQLKRFGLQKGCHRNEAWCFFSYGIIVVAGSAAIVAVGMVEGSG